MYPFGNRYTKVLGKNKIVKKQKQKKQALEGGGKMVDSNNRKTGESWEENKNLFLFSFDTWSK